MEMYHEGAPFFASVHSIKTFLLNSFNMIICITDQNHYLYNYEFRAFIINVKKKILEEKCKYRKK